MAYYLVKDFQRGLDTRRMVETTEAGSLIRAKNCVITRGGEIERRKAFFKVADLPDGVYGLYAQDSRVGQWHVWGDQETPPTFTDERIIYHYLPQPEGVTSLTLDRITAVTYYNKSFYVTARWRDANNDFIFLSYWDGELIVDNPPPPDAIEETPGEGVAPDPYPIGLGRATVSVTLTQLRDTEFTINKISAWRNLKSGDTFYQALGDGETITIPAGTSDEEMVQIISDAINAATTTPNFNSKYEGTTLIVSFDEYGVQNNDFTLQIGCVPLKAITPTPIPATFANGSNQFVPAASNSNTTPYDSKPAKGNGGFFVPGRYMLQHAGKMLTVDAAEGLLRFSALGSPNHWAQNYTGAGFIDFTRTGGKHNYFVNSLATFQNRVAIFAAKAVHIWNIDPDPAASFEVSILHKTGTFSPLSVTEFGNTDVFYLDQTGVRSLQSRDVSGEAFASDVGNPVDSLVQGAIRDMGAGISQATGTIDPEDGRYVLFMNKRIFVFTFFSNTKIAAWTEWEIPTDCQDLSSDSARMYYRDTNAIYSYGNMDPDADDYDDCEVDVQVPYLHAGKPATQKDIHGLDVALINEWTVDVGCDYSDIDLLERVGIIKGTTYREQKIPIQAYSTHCSFRLRCTEPGYAKIGNLAFHYRDGEEPG